jgi:hypothetical protein
MPVTQEENDKYGAFVQAKAREFGAFAYEPNQIVWHYTNGPGFLGILETASIFVTQVASLNDSKEIRYASDLFKWAVKKLIEEKADDAAATSFLNSVLEFVKEDSSAPQHGVSKFFVACFSGEPDDLVQWARYGEPNGYAIGFYARGLNREPNSRLYKVSYDRELQEKSVRELAAATLTFYLEGLHGERLQNPDVWAQEFYTAWDDWIYKFAPLAKEACWKAENEYRLVHELKVSEFGQVRFKQKKTMLARYLPLTTPSWQKRRTPLLPIAKIIIGPGNHSAFTSVSVKLLLEQLGYVDVPVEVTKVPLQTP